VTDTSGPPGGWTIRFGHSADDEERRREAFETMIDDALDQIPPPFRDRLDTVAIVAEDEPPPERVQPGQTLFGLFQGVPRTTWGADNAAIANKISIYRGPHERFYPDPAMRARAVEATVFHEVAHHFGISDDRLRELQHR
jgi:predicted Zn-dependent protease with MMP-like domain